MTRIFFVKKNRDNSQNFGTFWLRQNSRHLFKFVKSCQFPGFLTIYSTRNSWKSNTYFLCTYFSFENDFKSTKKSGNRNNRSMPISQIFCKVVNLFRIQACNSHRYSKRKLKSLLSQMLFWTRVKKPRHASSTLSLLLASIPGNSPWFLEHVQINETVK